MAANDDGARPIRRVVVLLDDSRCSRAALETAVDVAAREHAELIGLFVEDTDLLRSATLPFGREIGLTSGRIRPMSLEELEQRLRHQAEEVRRVLGAAARRRAVRWRLQVSRDRPDVATLAATTPDDLLVIARVGWNRRPGAGFGTPTANRIASGAHCAVMILNERMRDDHPVLVLYESTDAGWRTLAAAARLARDASEPLTILLPPASDAAPGGPLEAAAREWAERNDTRVRIVRIGGEDASTLVLQLQRERGRALVLSRGSRALLSATGRSLLDEIEIPVVVVP